MRFLILQQFQANGHVYIYHRADNRTVRRLHTGI